MGDGARITGGDELGTAALSSKARRGGRRGGTRDVEGVGVGSRVADGVGVERVEGGWEGDGCGGGDDLGRGGGGEGEPRRVVKVATQSALMSLIFCVCPS